MVGVGVGRLGEGGVKGVVFSFGAPCFPEVSHAGLDKDLFPLATFSSTLPGPPPLPR